MLYLNEDCKSVLDSMAAAHMGYGKVQERSSCTYEPAILTLQYRRREDPSFGNQEAMPFMACLRPLRVR